MPTVEQVKAELRSELEGRIKSLEQELKKLQAAMVELRGSLKTDHDHDDRYFKLTIGNQNFANLVKRVERLENGE